MPLRTSYKCIRQLQFTSCVYLINTSLFKGALLGLGKVLVTESPLKMMKNAFHFTLKALFVLKTFKFLS